MKNFLSGLAGLVGVGCIAGAGCAIERDSTTAELKAALSANLVIASVFGGGGNAQAPFTHDFVMLFNRGSAAASLNGLSLQYRSSNNDFDSATDVVALPNASLQPGQYFLIELNSNGNVGAPLPTPDASDTGVGLSNNNGKVALVTQPLDGCGAPLNPCPLTNIVDLVGYGTGSQFEGSGQITGLSNTVAAIRKGGGCTETDDNASDFEVGAPAPKNTTATFSPCNAPVDAGSGGTAGSDAGAGGSSGAAGSATGGNAGAATGGAAGAATGGAAGAATGGSGGVATGGTGGSSSGGVGAIGGFSGTGGKKSAPAEEDEGCGCSTPGSSGSPAGAIALAGLLLAMASRRRRG
jgi:MYXO-CTERM domain-containing protein